MKAQQLKNAILQLAIQGKLVPQDPNDEPVSVLLEKIQAEKEKLIAEGKIKKTNKTKKTSGKRPLDPETDFPFEIPDSWEWVRLGDIGETNIGLTYKPSDISSKGTIVLRSGNIQKDKINLSDTVKVNLDIPESKKCYKNDLLICARNGSKKLVGKAAIIDKDGYTFGAFMAIFRSRFNHYIYYYLLSPLFRNEFDGISTTTINQITQENLNNRYIPLPPLNEQKRIVAKIEELLPFIEEYDKKEQKLTTLNQQFPDQLKKSILQAAIQGQLVAQDPNDEPASELIKRIQAEKERLISEKKIKKPKVKSGIVVRDGLPYEIINGVERCIADELPFEIPESWCWMRLSEICSNIHYGYTASASSKGTHKLLRITDIQNNKVSWNDVPFCSLSEKEAENYTLKKGNIVIARTGGTIGKSFLINNIQEQSVFASYLIRIVLLSHVYEKYISYYLNSPFYWEQLRSYSMGTGQPNVNSVSLGCLFIPLPPLSEQKRIVQKIEEVFSHIESL
jgi:hypothetical protein